MDFLEAGGTCVSDCFSQPIRFPDLEQVMSYFGFRIAESGVRLGVFPVSTLRQ